MAAKDPTTTAAQAQHFSAGELFGATRTPITSSEIEAMKPGDMWKEDSGMGGSFDLKFVGWNGDKSVGQFVHVGKNDWAGKKRDIPRAYMSQLFR